MIRAFKWVPNFHIIHNTKLHLKFHPISKTMHNIRIVIRNTLTRILLKYNMQFENIFKIILLRFSANIKSYTDISLYRHCVKAILARILNKSISDMVDTCNVSTVSNFITPFDRATDTYAPKGTSLTV